MPGTCFLMMAMLAAIPAVFIYWPFVHNVTSGSCARSLFIASLCQFVSFLSSWATFMSIPVILYCCPFITNPWFLPEGERTLWINAFICAYQLLLVPLIGTVLALRITKEKTLRAGRILWAGHVLIGTLFFYFVFVILPQGRS